MAKRPTSLAASCDLQLIRLAESETQLSIIDVVPTNFTVKLGMRSRFDESKSLIYCRATFSMVGQLQDSIISISAVFDSIYGTSWKQVSDVELASLHDFALKDVWPYVRQYVHSTSLHMAVPPMVLPISVVQTSADGIGKIKAKSSKKKAAITHRD